MPKLKLTPELEQQVAEILAPLLSPDKWAALKLPFAPSPAAVVMLIGKPGTGKTALTQYMARKIGKPPVHISFAGVASPQYGETEAKITTLFNTANETESVTIIMEECDSILWSRDMITEDTITALGIVNTMLVEIDKFRARKIPSLLIFTTNHPKLLDDAFQSRITDTIELFAPKGDHAKRLWMMKLPVAMREAMTPQQFTQLAELGATPRQMENAILKVCRGAMVRGVQPVFADFGL